MTVGVMLVNLASQHRRTLQEVKTIPWPFKIAAFILVGASPDVLSILALVVLGVVLISGRRYRNGTINS